MSDLEQFAREVLNVLAIQDGTQEVFGRTLDLSDDGAMRLIRVAAAKIESSVR